MRFNLVLSMILFLKFSGFEDSWLVVEVVKQGSIPFRGGSASSMADFFSTVHHLQHLPLIHTTWVRHHL